MNSNGYIIFWFFGAIRNQLSGSRKSSATNLYRNFIFIDEIQFDYLNENKIEDKEEEINIMKVELNNLNKNKLLYTWRTWLELYVNGNETIQELADRLHIDKWNLVYGLRQVRQILKNNIEWRLGK